MLPARRNDGNLLWSEFQSIFSEFSGFSIQSFDEKGQAHQPAPKLPPLCAFFQHYPETNAACQKDCFRKATTCRDCRKVLSARCYAGLSYRVIPIRKRNRPHAVILVGRVLTEVFGGEQCLGFIERYKLSRLSFLESLAGVRSCTAPDLDRVAAFVRRAAFSLAAADTRLEQRHGLVRRGRDLHDFTRQVTAFHDRGPGRMREMLELLGRMLAVPGAALLLRGDEAHRVEVHSSVGLGEQNLAVLANQDWPLLLESHGRGSQLYLPDHQTQIRAGLDLAGAPLAVQRLEHGPHAVGYLVVSGAALSGRSLDLLESASTFLASRLMHEKCRDLAVRRDEETKLLGQVAEKFLTARSVDELLPLALEAAMGTLRARRGSIFLAEDRGRITAQALRGDHAPIAGTFEVLSPDTVSHKVFFNRRSLLVQDTDQEPGLKKERQFPYASRSFVSVPLRENGNALGVLHLTEREGEEVFTPRDLLLLERLGLQASGAIRKVRLEEEVQELRVASMTDHLTGAYNRRFLEEQLGIEFQRASRFGHPLAVAMLDLDGFKALNDEMGHAYGDHVLKEIAAIVRQQLRAVDILARYGGDEFVLVLPGTGVAGAIYTAEKIRIRIESTELRGDGPSSPQRKFTVSVGISVYPDTATVAADLLRRADEALFQAKKSGRNTALLWND